MNEPRSAHSSSRHRSARYRALADALAAGIAPLKALELIRLDGEPAGSAAAAALARGEPLTRAIELLADPPHHHLVALQAGERAGRLPETLRGLADEIDAESRAWRILWSRAAYPLLVLHLIAPAASTSLLIEAPSRFVARVVASWGAIWIALLGGAWLFRRLARHPRHVRTLARWPLVGPPLRLAAQLRFLRALAVLYGAGVRISEALSEASAAVGPAPPFPDFTQAAAVARAGESIEQAMSRLLHLDPLDRMELITAAQAGNLEQALERVVLRNEERWEASLQRAARIAGSILYVTAIVLVAVAIFSFYAGYFAKLTLPPR